MTDPSSLPTDPVARLLAIMEALRTPNTGCPWDLEQSFETIAPYTIEEAYEVFDAIERGNMEDLKEELGDLLFQSVFHAQLASEAGAFSFADVVNVLNEKMVRRHPHVFGARDDISSAEDQEASWEALKAAERSAKEASSATAPSLLDNVPLALPALLRALKLQKRAARVGFDWPTPERVLEKLHEEAAEVVEASERGASDDIHVEVGDLLFVAANLARKLNVDPETALRDANRKFERRFRYIEEKLRTSGQTPQAASLDDMEALWLEAKLKEKSGAL